MESLPDQIRHRILDMWRIEGIVSGYTRQARELDCYKEALRKTFVFVHKIASDDCSCGNKFSIIFEEENKITQELQTRTLDDTEAVNVNMWLEVTEKESKRLSVEVSLVYLQMALQHFFPPDHFSHPPETRNKKRMIWLARNYPLIYCLQRLRNFVVHFRELDVSQRDFLAESTTPQRDGTPLKLNFTGAWFLKVSRQDLEQTRGPNLPNLFDWFVIQCDQHPVWWLSRCTVEQVCQYYGMQNVDDGD